MLVSYLMHVVFGELSVTHGHQAQALKKDFENEATGLGDGGGGDADGGEDGPYDRYDVRENDHLWSRCILQSCTLSPNHEAAQHLHALGCTPPRRSLLSTVESYF